MALEAEPKGLVAHSKGDSVKSGRVLKVIPAATAKPQGRSGSRCQKPQRVIARAVAMENWRAFISATTAYAKNADIVFDCFHVSKHLDGAVCQYAHKEDKMLCGEDDPSLKRTKLRQLSISNGAT